MKVKVYQKSRERIVNLTQSDSNSVVKTRVIKKTDRNRKRRMPTQSVRIDDDTGESSKKHVTETHSQSERVMESSRTEGHLPLPVDEDTWPDIEIIENPITSGFPNSVPSTPFDNNQMDQAASYDKSRKYLDSLLISLIHDFLTTKSYPQSLLNFDLNYTGRTGKLRLDSGFQLYSSKTGHHLPFNAQCDLRTVLENILDKNFDQLATSSATTFEEIWTQEIKLKFKHGVSGNLIEKNIMRCIQGSLYLPQADQLCTRLHGQWISCDLDMDRLLQTHFWFVRFLERSLKHYDHSFYNQDGTILVKQSTDIFELPTSVSGENLNFDFIEVKSNGDILIYFLSPNFSRCTPSIVKKMKHWGQSILEEVNEDENKFRLFYEHYANVNNEKTDIKPDPGHDHVDKKVRQDYFRSVYRNWKHFTSHLRKAQFIYLLLRPIIGRNRFYFEKKLVTRVDLEVIQKWLKKPMTRKFFSDQNSPSLFNWDDLPQLILDDLINNNYLDKDGRITVKSLYVQRKDFKFSPLQNYKKRGGDMSLEFEKVEDKIFEIFESIQSNFTRQESKFELRQVEDFFKTLEVHGHHLQLNVMEMRHNLDSIK